MANNSLTEWQRRVALDFAKACSLEPVVPIRASGNSLSAENDEPEPDQIDRGPLTMPAELTDVDWDAADLAEDQGKGERRNALRDRIALEDQVQHLRLIGGL